MKRLIIFFLMLFLLMGIVSASDDANDTQIIKASHHDTLGVNETLQSNTDVKETPKITTSTVTGKAGKTITLKATVTTSKGPLKGEDVTFKLNGRTYTAKTDDNGVASIQVKCPKSAALKTTSKKKANTLTKKTTYSKTYACTVSVNGATGAFNVVSKKDTSVKKYKITKKDKVATVPVKSGSKTYKKGSYGIATYKLKYKGLIYLKIGMLDKRDGKMIKFFVKRHIKNDGSWDSWYKVKKGEIYSSVYPKNVKVDKVKIRYSKMSLKRIK